MTSQLAHHASTIRLALGIGCRRGTSAEAIESAVRAALGTLAFDAIDRVASIDAKQHEAGLLAFCARHRLKLVLYRAEEIARMPGAISAHAQRHMQVDGVCEPCALLASDGGRLIVHKTITGGVTVAIAQTFLNHEA